MNAVPVTEVMEVRETCNLPLLIGGVLPEGEKLGPKQEKRLHTETGDEERLWEGMMVHEVHGCPPGCHAGREQ